MSSDVYQLMKMMLKVSGLIQCVKITQSYVAGEGSEPLTFRITTELTYYERLTLTRTHVKLIGFSEELAF